MKTQGRRKSENIQDRRNSGAISEFAHGMVGGFTAIGAGIKRSLQDLSGTGPFDGRTLGQTYKDFVAKTTDTTNDNLKGK